MVSDSMGFRMENEVLEVAADLRTHSQHKSTQNQKIEAHVNNGEMAHV